MERLEVDNEIVLEILKLSMAETIFLTIDRDRNYLKQWLPFVNHTKKQTDTEFFIKSTISDDSQVKNLVFSIHYRNTFAGLISLKDIDYLNRKTEIGYWLAEVMQGKGIITRSVKKMMEYAFRNLNLNRIQIKVAVGNKKSAAIPSRLGFEFEGIERDGEFHTYKYFNLETYSFLRKDWIDSIK